MVWESYDFVEEQNYPSVITLNTEVISGLGLIDIEKG